MGKFHFTFICWGRYFSKKKHNICSQFDLKNNTPIKKNNKCYNYYSFGLKITLLSKKTKKLINATIIIVLVLKITYLEKNKQIIKKFYNSNR